MLAGRVDLARRILTHLAQSVAKERIVAGYRDNNYNNDEDQEDENEDSENDDEGEDVAICRGELVIREYHLPLTEVVSESEREREKNKCGLKIF